MQACHRITVRFMGLAPPKKLECSPIWKYYCVYIFFVDLVKCELSGTPHIYTLLSFPLDFRPRIYRCWFISFQTHPSPSIPDGWMAFTSHGTLSNFVDFNFACYSAWPKFCTLSRRVVVVVGLKVVTCGGVPRPRRFIPIHMVISDIPSAEREEGSHLTIR